MEKPSWAQAHRSVAKRLLARRNDKEGLVDSLSWALETCCVQFPIVEAGEALDALDPFTFMAAWCRPMPEARKERLFLLACEALELEVAETPSFYDCPEVEDYQVRMFSHRDKTMGEEIERLWDLFAAAMGLSAGDAEDADERDALVCAFIHAYERRRPVQNPRPHAPGDAAVLNRPRTVRPARDHAVHRHRVPGGPGTRRHPRPAAEASAPHRP